jgi:hypothetical protein
VHYLLVQYFILLFLSFIISLQFRTIQIVAFHVRGGADIIQCKKLHTIVQYQLEFCLGIDVYCVRFEVFLIVTMKMNATGNVMLSSLDKIYHLFRGI